MGIWYRCHNEDSHCFAFNTLDYSCVFYVIINRINKVLYCIVSKTPWRKLLEIDHEFRHNKNRYMEVRMCIQEIIYSHPRILKPLIRTDFPFFCLDGHECCNTPDLHLNSLNFYSFFLHVLPSVKKVGKSITHGHLDVYYLVLGIDSAKHGLPN